MESSMERVRLPLEYTVRQSGARGHLISHFYWWVDCGVPNLRAALTIKATSSRNSANSGRSVRRILSSITCPRERSKRSSQPGRLLREQLPGRSDGPVHPSESRGYVQPSRTLPNSRTDERVPDNAELLPSRFRDRIGAFLWLFLTCEPASAGPRACLRGNRFVLR